MASLSDPRPRPTDPAHLIYALSLVGLKEVPGTRHNPRIIQMFHDVGHSWVMDDETAWCAAFVGSVLKRTRHPHTGKLTARSYETYGKAVPESDWQRGDIAVFTRGGRNAWTGHVGFIVGFDRRSIWLVSGNSSNSVNVAAYPRSQLLAVRRPPSMHAGVPEYAAAAAMTAAGGAALLDAGDIAISFALAAALLLAIWAAAERL